MIARAKMHPNEARATTKFEPAAHPEVVVDSRDPNAPPVPALKPFPDKFLGLPYSSTLIGSAQQPEVFVASLDRFDCVTYIETVVALARASNAAQFAEFLRHLRYDHGRVAWEKRNHYMTHLDS